MDTTNPEAEVEVVDDIEETATEEFDSENLAENVGDEPEDDTEDSENEPVDDDEEIEINGKQYRVPKDAALRQSDYTRKTQEIAETRKALSEALERVNSASEAEQQAMTQKAILQAQRNQYNNINWQQLDQQNPLEATRLRQAAMMLDQAITQADQKLIQARNDTRSAAEQETAKRLEEGHKTLAQQIPDWGPDKANAIRSFAIETYGFSNEDIDSLTDPKAVLALHDAMEYRKGQKKAATAKSVQKQQALKPAAKVKKGAGNVATAPNAKMSDEQWYAARERQIAARRKQSAL